MIDLCTTHPELCCGCGACAAACPLKAIVMAPSDNGFLYPTINEELCIKCGICLKTCDFKSFKPTGRKPACYAVKHSNDEEVRTSRSGAFFMAICQYVIEQGGVVYGAELDSNLVCCHMSEDTYTGCYHFKGSKYVQSDLRNTFLECADALIEGRVVCYSGTGCQVHGLISYLQQKHVPTNNLITVDIVCQGVPSIGVWKDFIEKYKDEIGAPITCVDFRDKSVNGWADNIQTYITSEGMVLHSNAWGECYNRHILFRESCYNCRYTTTERYTDFTIGDYWGIGANVPEFNDGKGCSLVLVQSEKGKKLLNEIKCHLVIQETKLETSLQPQLRKPIYKGWDYRWFWRCYLQNRSRAISLFFFPPWPIKLLRTVEKQFKKSVKAGINIFKKALDAVR